MDRGGSVKHNFDVIQLVVFLHKLALSFPQVASYSQSRDLLAANLSHYIIQLVTMFKQCYVL